jgi:hypothetical protein
LRPQTSGCTIFETSVLNIEKIMALDFQQVREQIRKLGEKAPLRAQMLRELNEKAFEILKTYAQEPDNLRQKIQLITRNYDPNLRCALPAWGPGGVAEPIDASFQLPSPPAQATILAADGSQITPDRHAAVFFGLINVGAIQMQHGSPHPPAIKTTSRLFYDEELIELTDATLALKRDINERAMLAELAAEADSPVVTFTDGPIELWGVRESGNASQFQESMSDYLSVLQRLKSLNVSTAGYVDKPAANLVVRLLEVAITPQDLLGEIKKSYPLRGVTDFELYRNLLASGERSAVFSIQSRSAAAYRHEDPGLALHFFYLNVGRPDHPWLARIEIPAWVAEQQELLDSLHAILVSQSRIMGNRPYPYLLHRAHEAALVSFEERDQVTQMILLELRQRGVNVGEISYKQSAKDLPSRTRYER